MKLKKIGKKIVMLGAIGMICVGGILPVFANNYHDTSYVFNFGKLNGARYTDGRKKEDASSSYMNCQRITPGYSYTASVVASIGKDVYKEVGSESYDFVSGTKKSMSNYVVERGYRAAAIKAKSGINSKDVTASGLWSPDKYRG